MSKGIVFIIIAAAFALLILLTLHERHKEYTDKDLILRYIPCENNSYYFALPILFYQYKKREIARKLYPQGALIEVENDHSTHIVTRWGGYIDGNQQIFAQPYMPQLNQQIIRVETQNYGTINICYNNQQTIYNLENEIKNQYSFDKDSEEILSILEQMSNKQSLNKTSLQKLLDFIKKYEPLVSLASDLLPIIIGLLGIS